MTSTHANAADTIARGFARTSHGQIHYRRAGKGSPLVLLHNTGLSSRMYLGIIPALAQHFTVYTLDTLGQGDSDPVPPGNLEMADFGAIVLEALDSLGLDSIYLAGHHCGAAIAAETTIQDPARIRRLVISGMPYWRNPATRLAQLDNPRFADVPASTDGSHLQTLWTLDTVTEFGSEYRNDAFIDHLKASPRVFAPLHALFRWDSTARLPLIPVETLLLCSDGDLFRKNMGYAQQQVPNSSLQILPMVEHHPLYNQAAFAGAISTFFGAPPADS